MKHRGFTGERRLVVSELILKRKKCARHKELRFALRQQAEFREKCKGLSEQRLVRVNRRSLGKARVPIATPPFCSRCRLASRPTTRGQAARRHLALTKFVPRIVSASSKQFCESSRIRRATLALCLKSDDQTSSREVLFCGRFLRSYSACMIHHEQQQLCVAI